MQKIYKRTLPSFLKSLLLSLFAALAAWFISSCFISDPKVTYSIGGVLFLLMLRISVFSENIRIELDALKLRYYVNGKLKEEVTFDENLLSYGISTSNSTDSANLSFEKADESSQVLDIAPLGSGQIATLMTDLEQFLGKAPKKLETQKLETKKKGE